MQAAYTLQELGGSEYQSEKGSLSDKNSVTSHGDNPQGTPQKSAS